MIQRLAVMHTRVKERRYDGTYRIGSIVSKIYRRLGIACVSVKWDTQDAPSLAFVKELELV